MHNPKSNLCEQDNKSNLKAKETYHTWSGLSKRNGERRDKSKIYHISQKREFYQDIDNTEECFVGDEIRVAGYPHKTKRRL